MKDKKNLKEPNDCIKQDQLELIEGSGEKMKEKISIDIFDA